MAAVIIIAGGKPSGGEQDYRSGAFPPPPYTPQEEEETRIAPREGPSRGEQDYREMPDQAGAGREDERNFEGELNYERGNLPGAVQTIADRPDRMATVDRLTPPPSSRQPGDTSTTTTPTTSGAAADAVNQAHLERQQRVRDYRNEVLNEGIPRGVVGDAASLGNALVRELSGRGTQARQDMDIEARHANRLYERRGRANVKLLDKNLTERQYNRYMR